MILQNIRTTLTFSGKTSILLTSLTDGSAARRDWSSDLCENLSLVTFYDILCYTWQEWWVPLFLGKSSRSASKRYSNSWRQTITICLDSWFFVSWIVARSAFKLYNERFSLLCRALYVSFVLSFLRVCRFPCVCHGSWALLSCFTIMKSRLKRDLDIQDRLAAGHDRCVADKFIFIRRSLRIIRRIVSGEVFDSYSVACVCSVSFSSNCSRRRQKRCA